MTDIDAIQAFLDWQEERRLEDKPRGLYDYEEYLRVQSLETRIREVQRILGDTTIHPSSALDLIGGILHDDVLA